MQTVLFDIYVSFYCYPVDFRLSFRNLADIEQKRKEPSWWNHDIGIITVYYCRCAFCLLLKEEAFEMIVGRFTRYNDTRHLSYREPNHDLFTEHDCYQITRSLQTALATGIAFQQGMFILGRPCSVPVWTCVYLSCRYEFFAKLVVISRALHLDKDKALTRFYY